MKDKSPFILFFLLATTSICLAQKPVANFSSSAPGGCSPFKVKFTDQSTGNIEKRLWDLGNNVTSSLKDPSSFYVTPGVYSVKLTVSNASGSDTKTGSITVYENPKPKFISDKRNGCAPLQVRFTDQTEYGTGNSGKEWLWDFGNGLQSTEQNPTIKYNTQGTFTVALKVTSDKGCVKVITEEKYINVTGGLGLDFTNTPGTVCQGPYSISFNSTSTTSGGNYFWNFGDGKTSSDRNPTNIYQSSGSYNVTLIGNKNGCTDTVTKTIDLSETKTDFTISDKFCVNSPVFFTNASIPAPLKTLWEFSDGSNSNTKDAQKTFSSPGTYNVKLTNTYTGCTDTKTKQVIISEGPVPKFSPSALSNCSAPFTVNFKNNSINASQTIWNFGDGSQPLTAGNGDVSHTYTSLGTFFVSVTAINNSGCTATIVSDKPIIVRPPRIAITGLPPFGCLPLSVSPEPEIYSLSAVESYEWDFGGGIIRRDKLPSHYYTIPGNHVVKLTVKTVDGCTVSTSIEMQLGTHGKPSFTASPRDVCARDTVYFTNNSEPKDAKYKWLFGDGNTSTQFSPAYSYNDTGFFRPKLIIDNNGCMDTLVAPLKYIHIQAPVARFSLKPVCEVAYQYQIIDESLFDKESEGKRTWVWTMPDGSTSDKSSPPPYTFPGPGTYKITLTISNGICTHTMMDNVVIYDKGPKLEQDKNTACKLVSITFKAVTPVTQKIVKYQWSLKGFDTTTFTNQFTHIFQKAGVDTLVLTTIDTDGCKNNLKTPLQINGPKAAFARIDKGICKKLTATLKDESKAFGTNKIVSWKWDFGDGNTLEKTDSSQVEHVYAKTGLYSIRLIIKDAAGCIDSTSTTDSVKITDIKADWTANDKACLGFPITFDNKSTGEYVSYSWDFGDSSNFYPMANSGTYLYKDTGYYDVKLTIKDVLGCSDSLLRKQYVHVSQPVASFQVNDSISFCLPFDAQFTNTSQFYKNVEWQVGDEKSVEIDHRKLFTEPGTYDVGLKVTSPDGNCVATSSREIIVYNTADAKLKYDPLQACVPGIVNLSAFDNLAPVKFFWDFGDGNILDTSASKISHTYTDLGSFTPKIILTESSGCIITIEGLVPIQIKGVKTKFDVEKSFFCDSGLIKILDSTVFNDPIVAYNWDFGDGTVSNEKSPQHNYKKEGLYNITLNVKTASGCVDSTRLSTPIKIVKAPILTIAGDSLICIDERIKHTGVLDKPDSLLKWNWQFPNGALSAVQNPPIQQYHTAGNFQIKTIVTNTSGCADTAVKNIKVFPNPTVSLPEILEVPLGGSVLLPAEYSSTSLTYSWTPDSTLNCKTCPRPVAKPNFDTKYDVTFVDANGCANKGGVQVVVLCKGVTVFLPNTFSPNGDGVNDVFYVRGQGLDRIKFLRIFNRWGEVVFEQKDFVANNALYGWNGKYKGFKAQPDVYVYQLEIFCGNSELMKFSGNVALIQ